MLGAVAALRSVLKRESLNAFIIPTDDAHGVRNIVCFLFFLFLDFILFVCRASISLKVTSAEFSFLVLLALQVPK